MKNVLAKARAAVSRMNERNDPLADRPNKELWQAATGNPNVKPWQVPMPMWRKGAAWLLWNLGYFLTGEKD